MDQTDNGRSGCKLKGIRWNSSYKIDYQVSNINNGLIEYVTRTIVNKEVRKNSNMLILLLIVSIIYLGWHKGTIKYKQQYNITSGYLKNTSSTYSCSD